LKAQSKNKYKTKQAESSKLKEKQDKAKNPKKPKAHAQLWEIELISPFSIEPISLPSFSNSE